MAPRAEPPDAEAEEPPPFENFFGYGTKPIDAAGGADILEQTIVRPGDPDAAAQDDDESGERGSRLRRAVSPLLGKRKKDGD